MPPKKKKAYGVGAAVAAGTILKDCFKAHWRLGKAFAVGGFGRRNHSNQAAQKCADCESDPARIALTN